MCPRRRHVRLFVWQPTSFPSSVRSFPKQIWKEVAAVKTKDYVKELNTKSIEELNSDLTAAKKELFNLKFQNATNQLENTSRITIVRKNIARIQTAISAKKNA
jgi:large subunit ribosomal protein L29